MTERVRSLNIDAVAAFVLATDLASFTRAAEALATTQAAISMHVRKLETQLGCRLLERTPRQVRLSAAGATFIPRARALLQAHENALASARGGTPVRLRIGLSEQVVGPELPLLLAHLRSHAALVVLELTLGYSRDLLEGFTTGALDAVIVRDDPTGAGTILFKDDLGWFAAKTWTLDPAQPLPLATLSSDCGVRSLATRLLDEAGVQWTEVFVGGGLAATSAAVLAGLAVAPMPRRLAPSGVTDVGTRLGLPELPASQVALHAKVIDHQAAEAVRALSAFLKRQAGGPSKPRRTR